MPAAADGGAIDHAVLLELALTAMDELVKVAHMDEPLWLPSLDGDVGGDLDGGGGSPRGERRSGLGGGGPRGGGLRSGPWRRRSPRQAARASDGAPPSSLSFSRGVRASGDVGGVAAAAAARLE
ncbi:hypothetical protein OsI_23377 [Oryza sativa Indica Group]|uniref:START domain-containing protein n=1 Tax=Oryza sativa subsp. indica TaxID=39946 RepID=A2YE32_ORYSI|nr:hypothetical protein OsI_23377 [Oryza sativa Indica Group]